MSEEKLIRIKHLCKNYELEMSFFSELHDLGVIEILTVKETYFIHEDEINILEKVVRMHKELHINLAGVDAVLNLLDKINALNSKLTDLKNRLKLYEE